MQQIEQLQTWYTAQCNGKWEHTYGIAIGTLDNPGWSLTVDLTGTALAKQPFETITHGVDDDDEPEEADWVVCRVENGVFTAFGGARQLTTIIDHFLNWSAQA